MNAIETIIDAASPLTDYQQLILDCRIYSENEIKNIAYTKMYII